MKEARWDQPEESTLPQCGFGSPTKHHRPRKTVKGFFLRCLGVGPCLGLCIGLLMLLFTGLFLSPAAVPFLYISAVLGAVVGALLGLAGGALLVWMNPYRKAKSVVDEL
jgi:hypothetical protein